MDGPRLPTQEAHTAATLITDPDHTTEPTQETATGTLPTCEDAAQRVYAHTHWRDYPSRPRFRVSLILVPTASLTYLCGWSTSETRRVCTACGQARECLPLRTAPIRAPHACVLTARTPRVSEKSPPKASPAAGSPTYLPHLAVVLLVVGKVVWDLGSARKTHVEAQEGARHRHMQTPGWGGAHTEGCGVPKLWPLGHRCLRGPSRLHPLPTAHTHCQKTPSGPHELTGQGGGTERAPPPMGGPSESPVPSYL